MSERESKRESKREREIEREGEREGERERDVTVDEEKWRKWLEEHDNNKQKMICL